MQLESVQKQWKLFMKKVRKGPALDDCWGWTGNKNKGGYGNFHVPLSGRPKTETAHRVSFLYHWGFVPQGRGEMVLHRCNNPECANPHHLYIGTPAQNMKDRRRNGTYCAEHVGNTKLTQDQVRVVRQRWENRRAVPVTQVKMAAELGVSQTLIYYVVHRRTWKHVG